MHKIGGRQEFLSEEEEYEYKRRGGFGGCQGRLSCCCVGKIDGHWGGPTNEVGCQCGGGEEESKQGGGGRGVVRE